MILLQEWLSRACTQLGLRLELDCLLTLDSGRQIKVLAWIPELGAPKGMIIAQSYEKLQNVITELIESGYGYSVLSDPQVGEHFDLTSYIEMFSDWGWPSGTKEKPSWMSTSDSD